MATLTLGTAGNYTWYLDYTLSQNIAANQSTVSYTLRIHRNVSSGDGAWWGTPARTFNVDIGGAVDSEAFASVDFRAAADINFTSGSFTWTHNADGTMGAKAVYASVSGSAVSSGFPVPTTVGGVTISFPTIPRAATSITRSGSTETGSASTLTISPLVSSFYYVLQYKSPLTTTWTTIGPAGGIVGSSWPYSHTVPHAEIPNAASGTIQYQVTTKQTSGGTTIGSPVSTSFTYTVPSTVLPTVGVPTWAEGATTTGLSTLTNAGAVFAQGWSRLKPTFTSSPGTGATLSSAVATVNGHTGSVSSTGTFAAPITTQGSSATFSVVATDSRSRTDTETGTVTPAVHRWALPTANAGSPVITPTVTTQTIALSGFSATTTSFYLSAAQRNVLETRTGYRDLTTAGAWIYGLWTARALSTSDSTDNAYAPGTALTVATGLDPTHQYQVALQVRDIFGKNSVNYSTGQPYVESSLIIPAQNVLIAFDGNTRVGIKKIPTLGDLDVAGEVYAENGLRLATRSYSDGLDAATRTVFLPALGRANLLDNGSFRINQRKATSGTSLENAAYFLDRWRSGSAANAVTWTGDDVSGRVLTIPAGGTIQQLIEGADMPPGTYTLSWTGTATAAFYKVGESGITPVASPMTRTLTDAANVVVQFSAGTVSKVSLVPGSTAATFAEEPLVEDLASCQRHFYRVNAGGVSALFGVGVVASATVGAIGVSFPVTMRATPTLTFSGSTHFDLRAAGTLTVTNLALSGGSGQEQAAIDATTSGGTAGQAALLRSSAAGGANAWLAFSADMT